MTIRRRKKPTILLPLASMGDIAFLLIIFFMLVSSFMKNNQEFDPATSEDIIDLPTAEISVVLDKDNRLWIQGLEISSSDLAGALEVLVQERRRETEVHVSIHKDLTRTDYMPVMEALSEAGVRFKLTGQLSEA